MSNFTDVKVLLTEKIPLQNIHDATYPATDGYVWEVRKKGETEVFYVEDLSLFMHKIKPIKETTWGTRFYAEADPAVTPKKSGIPPYIIKQVNREGLNIADFEARLIPTNPEITIVGGMEIYLGTINSRIDNIEARADYQSDAVWNRSQPAKYPIGPNNNIVEDEDWHDAYIRNPGLE